MTTYIKKFRRLAHDIALGRPKAVYAHVMDGISVPADFIPDIKPAPSDIELAKRLIRSYTLALADSPSLNGKEDLWTENTKHLKSFFEILDSQDANRLASYLCNMSRHEAAFAVQGAKEYRHLKRSLRYRAYIARMAKDKLILLAEAIGALPCENLEQGLWGYSGRMAERTLVEKIEQTLGMDIVPPAIDGGLFKIGYDNYRFGERDCNAIYTAWLMRGKLPAQEDVTVCEIGGGVGRVAYWATRFGINNYTLIDLPWVNVLQGFYLIKALAQANVCLYGEDTSRRDPAKINITIVPSFAYQRLPQRLFDLVLNQDSFPEINSDVVSDYLAWVKSSAKSFLSINHENKPNAVNGQLQNNVPDLIAHAGGFIRQSRELYWLRKGYVCEFYDINEKNLATRTYP